MTDTTIKVIDVKAQDVDTLSDQIYVDSSNNVGLNIYNTKVPLLGSKTFSES